MIILSLVEMMLSRREILTLSIFYPEQHHFNVTWNEQEKLSV